MPRQQNPYKAGVETVLVGAGYSHRDSFTIGPGGQTVFTTLKEIGNEVTVFEDGIITAKSVTITGTNEVTTGLMPEGTIVDIIY